ncbi:Glycosyltransferase involved in cell wall bisynthesis [Flavobacterium resistens]|uniref:Glycosyltransferase n=1 Tax=Flavobacterium resistens TaxID=443612 RepID=A0A521ERA4_9FLAO|nr:glycosyltransferase family 2 protein [Flavobacterium resistens]MRX67910.1 glycosyltransferase [Flavobacterium resistens]SMO86427.1 Glycosyltransferase involved in cell wall bisynthesis [Flavobacterium resistens]
MKTFFPLISVIVPNFNHSSYLAQRLDTIFNQTYQNFEVILLDDKSTDVSREILSQYAKNEKVTHCVFNEINSGNTFKQWSKGISLAKGDLIWIAESDDFCENNFLEKVIKPFQDEPELVLSYCQSNRVNQNGEITGNWITHTDNLNQISFLENFVQDGNEFIKDFLIYKNVIPNASAVVFKKKNAHQVGEFDFDPVLKTCGDWLFYIKLVNNGKIAFVHESLNNFRYHSDSVISRSLHKDQRTSIIDIELKTRKKIIKFLFENKSAQLPSIFSQNKKINIDLKYEKGLLFLETNKKIRGMFVLGSILSTFLKRYKLKQKLKSKIVKIIK